MSLEPVVFNRDHLSSSIGIEDPAVLAMIYQEYLDRLEEFLAILESGLSDTDVLARELHTMLSSSRSVGALELGELIRSGEAAVTGRDMNAHFDRDELTNACRRAQAAIRATLQSLSG